ncbi:hypothetical protein H2248_004166 [Termitomyces sp. 'cryptogamus']|nr:hypothetical protein H2248_004166 [Termitomyces sp. 'cryptogamus']
MPAQGYDTVEFSQSQVQLGCIVITTATHTCRDEHEPRIERWVAESASQREMVEDTRCPRVCDRVVRNTFPFERTLSHFLGSISFVLCINYWRNYLTKAVNANISGRIDVGRWFTTEPQPMFQKVNDVRVSWNATYMVNTIYEWIA